ncbi:MAG: hypothetical protein H0U98_11415 [Alphaproteobacteria bacterium]|nr:hypothetical protein [Alphaproteobacteria bacterium]
MRALLAALILIAGCVSAQAAPHFDQRWRITKDHWDPSDEAGYGAFITALGDSGCSSSQSCLRDPANPYRGSDGRFLDIDVDCAKLPYLLRAYYAWKNGLPFSYVDGVSGSRFGHQSNRIVSRAGMIDHGGGINGAAAIRTLLDNVYSGTFRTDAAQDGGIPADFYSPALQPGSIRPGTVIYDTNAHVGIVTRVDGAGRIYYMDAHPDFTISRSVYGPQFGQSPASLGGGLKNWRPLQLQGAHWQDGALVGGLYVLARNSQIADFSLVQYFGTERDGSWRYNGARLGYYEYARVAVSGGKTDFNPVYELQATMGTLCNDLNDRAQAVNQAVANGISAKLHPSAIPANIYSSEDGEWEAYATPARDARLRAAFVAFRQELGKMIGQWLNRDSRVVYDGLDLKRDLLAAYDRESQACAITILSSDKRPVPLSFDDISHRLFAMSFDPYNCVELRWGGDGMGCPDQAGKRRYYALEEQARRVIDADTGAMAGPQDVDIRGLIAAMPARAPWVQRMPGDNRQSALP